MTLQTSGAISMSQLNTEFAKGNNLGAYRGTTWYKPDGTSGVFPSIGLTFSSFLGTQVSSPATSWVGLTITAAVTTDSTIGALGANVLACRATNNRFIVFHLGSSGFARYARVVGVSDALAITYGSGVTLSAASLYTTIPVPLGDGRVAVAGAYGSSGGFLGYVGGCYTCMVRANDMTLVAGGVLQVQYYNSYTGTPHDVAVSTARNAYYILHLKNSNLMLTEINYNSDPTNLSISIGRTMTVVAWADAVSNMARMCLIGDTLIIKYGNNFKVVNLTSWSVVSTTAWPTNLHVAKMCVLNSTTLLLVYCTSYNSSTGKYSNVTVKRLVFNGTTVTPDSDATSQLLVSGTSRCMAIYPFNGSDSALLFYSKAGNMDIGLVYMEAQEAPIYMRQARVVSGVLSVTAEQATGIAQWGTSCNPLPEMISATIQKLFIISGYWPEKSSTGLVQRTILTAS